MDQKTFQALAHGQEWANFYESFDRLVQDNLNRSSELLRRAMTLPEVADREVTRVKAESEARLLAERERNKSVLVQLSVEVSANQQQVAKIARGLGKAVDDLQRLNARIAEALAAYDRVDIDAVVVEEPAEVAPAPMSFAAAEPAPPAEPKVDLSAIAAAEKAEEEPKVGTAAIGTSSIGTSAINGERPRPHWLSVSKTAPRQ